MEHEQLAGELRSLFAQKGYKWRVDGRLKSVTKADILEVVKEVEQRLANEPEGTWYEVGRLIFIKEAGLIDVYALHGSLKETNEQSPTEPVL